MSKHNTSSHTTAQNNNYANQHNPNNAAYHASANNHSNQCNPNNGAYHTSRGEGK